MLPLARCLLDSCYLVEGQLSICGSDFPKFNVQQSVAFGDGAESFIEVRGHAGSELDRATGASSTAAVTDPPPRLVERARRCNSLGWLAQRGGAGIAISAASKLLLASVSGGGAPSVLRRLNFERSAILLHLVDQGLNKCIGLGVEPRIAGLGDRPADIMALR